MTKSDCCPICLNSATYRNLKQKGWLLERSLIRVNNYLHLPKCHELEKFQPKTIVICGNGSVGAFSSINKNCDKGEDVWTIIQKAVSEFKTTPEGRGVGIPSKHINCLHWTSSTERLVRYYGTEKTGSMDDAILTPAKILRQKIADKLSVSNIKLRKIQCFDCKCENSLEPKELSPYGVITLNWDTAVEELPNTIHLHGKINHPECLVLPNQDFIKLQPEGGKLNQGFGSFHTARNWFDHCQNVLFWGCKFNDYDSILLTVLTSTTLTKQKNLNFFICNPSKAELKEKLKDYFPLANFIDCLSQFKNRLGE